MTTPVTEREPSAKSGGEATPRNARLSRFLRAKRPLPATRREADELFRPGAGIAPAGGMRLHRANVLGLLELRATPGEPITQGQAHEAILDAIYGPEEPHEQAAEGDGV